MLKELHVRNLALIREAELEFGRGLNLLSGETGAGKSILLGAILLCLGQRSDASFIRTGAESAVAELSFTADTKEIEEKLEKLGFLPEEGVYRLSRRVTKEKSIARINGETVPLKKLKEVSSLFIDVYGQHEQEELLSEEQHVKILDAFPDEDVAAKKTVYKEKYHAYRVTKDLMNRLGEDEAKRNGRIDYLSFAVNELESFDLKAGEEERLKSRLRSLRAGAILRSGLGSVLHTLSDETAEELGDTMQTVRDLVNHDSSLSELFSLLTDAEAVVQDAIRLTESKIPEEGDEVQQIEETEERLEKLLRIRQKYGGSEEAVFQTLDAMKKELAELIDLAEKKEEIEKAFSEAKSELVKAAEDLHCARSLSASRFDEVLTDSLQALNFPYVTFVTKVDKTTRYTIEGADEVRFLFSANEGEAPKPVSKVASGGELSRIMLAIKTAAVPSDEVGRTWLFDEIDTGISGKTAKDVGMRLRRLSSGNQVICISHLPQIVSAADVHFKIEKSFENGETVTATKKLDPKESLEEVARLLGTGKITETVLQNAAELREEMRKGGSNA